MSESTEGDARVPPEEKYPGTPGWVKAFAFVIAGLLLLFLVVVVLGTALGVHSPMPGGHGG